MTAGIGDAAPAEPLLKVESVAKHFGGVHALRNVSFSVSRGEIVGLIGPNGSGKSTCVNVLSGMLPLTSGRIWFRNDEITGEPMDRVVRRGLVRTFQSTQLFPESTVFENVLIGCHTLFAHAPAASVLNTSSARNEETAVAVHAEEAIALVGLTHRRDVVASALSAAEQRLLMIAVVLASKPELILLDEPAAGMVANERRHLAGIIRALPRRGISVLVIEHHMGLIMDVSDRIVVLNFGQKIGEGTPAEIRANENVIDAYLGRRHHA
jgi:ABC-type branched-subunit amino acid transport system ATPase component